MPTSVRSRSGRKIIVPTTKEEAAINAAIAQDPDTYVLDATEFQQLRRAGRPRAAVRRPMLGMRTDPDVLEKLRASGPGWQTRVNAVLREAVEKGLV